MRQSSSSMAKPGRRLLADADGGGLRSAGHPDRIRKVQADCTSFAISSEIWKDRSIGADSSALHMCGRPAVLEKNLCEMRLIYQIINLP